MKRSGRILAVAALGLAIALVGRETLTLGAPAAQFTILAAQGPAYGELNFNGASGGKLVVTVPNDAQVKLTLQNQGALPHNLPAHSRHEAAASLVTESPGVHRGGDS